ncbi:GRAM domain-containing protein 2B-like isoform X1 [Nerophis lumbriciformis]|uniref:GRAM domain-containing protein 2B-like isoform X1 n=1 Tax=Nerophis lumbriciformis TaxID=546530 RepID=UPI002AE021F8|nr:GRAM domain-containing protein 2B-like isoform X1 [Nerophis lumbriciformis]
MTEASTGQREEARRACRGTSRADEKENHVPVSSDLDVAAEERQRCARIASERLQAAEAEHQEVSGCRKATLVRSKTLDPSLLTQVQTELDSKVDRKKSHYSQLSKSNCQYHKAFKEISSDEHLRQSYTCALQKDILYQGRMFVSDHWICFHSKVFGKDTKIAIPVISVTHVKKTKTAILVNAVVIATANDRYVFVSFLSRDNTYKFLMSVCLHLEERSPCSSPVPSSSHNNARTPTSPRFPLGFRSNFGDLGGALRDRRRDMAESSSSDSPDEEKLAALADFPVAPFLEALKHGEGSAEHHFKKQERVAMTERRMQTLSLNTLLCFYLLLVCVLVLSSCYLSVKMFSLEQRLTTLGSMADLAQHQKDLLQGSGDVSSELLSELLTINLRKLEKVQKNLQRLLDEAA